MSRLPKLENRTGVTAGLILALPRVDEATIVAEYSLTEDRLRSIRKPVAQDLEKKFGPEGTE